ncbi:MAG: M50 family metallopeptidase [Ornithinibacter sp.]
MTWAEAVWARVVPTSEPLTLASRDVAVVLLIAAVAVLVPALWRVVRLLVTLVHELGHAGVGVLVGRRFTGFVLRGDMSGHAVTVGPSRGPGLVATTWAGYPAPAVVGALGVWLAVHGWAAPVLTAILVALVAVTLRVRSLLTAAVVGAVGLTAGALWWQAGDARQAQVVVGVGVVLLVGAWRHLGAVLGTGRDSGSDPAALGRMTGIPRAVWSGTFVIVCAAMTWVSVNTLLGSVSAAGLT